MPDIKSEHCQTISRFLNVQISRKNELCEMAELASVICQTTIAMINLIDREKQYIIFKVGTQLDFLVKEDTFCQYIREGQDLLIVPDALKDQRFYTNPLVCNSPHMRFYAGVPLTTAAGLTIGSMCVLGQAPKVLSESQILRFKMLAKRVVEILEIEFENVA